MSIATKCTCGASQYCTGAPGCNQIPNPPVNTMVHSSVQKQVPIEKEDGTIIEFLCGWSEWQQLKASSPQ
jgi:hypothetical protein